VNDYKNHVVIPDPERAVLVKKLFELYAEGDYSLEELHREVNRWGLTGKEGKPVRKSVLASILRNPFYYGVMLYRGGTMNSRAGVRS